MGYTLLTEPNARSGARTRVRPAWPCEAGAAPGLQDELATVVRMLHGGLGFDEGGVL